MRNKLSIILLIFYGFLILIAITIFILSIRTVQKTTVIVEWVTASELDVAGYNIYRSISPQDSYIKINPILLPPSVDPQTGGTYRFEDQEVMNGTTYYYDLESVNNNGIPSRFGPIKVQAQNQGWKEMIVAGMLFLIGLSGIFIILYQRRVKRSV